MEFVKIIGGFFAVTLVMIGLVLILTAMFEWILEAIICTLM
jgi:hypothetical protein